MAVPLLPDSAAGQIEDVIAGAHDADFAAVAANLKSHGHPNASIRLGWEFNGDSFAWSGLAPPSFRAAFRHVVGVFRSVDPRFSFDWNPDGFRNRGAAPVEDSYPGDDVVDAVGVDVYDTQPGSPRTPAEFAAWSERPLGLDHWLGFAQQHHKRFAVPEWGLDGTGIGGGDNPPFVAGMYGFFHAHARSLAYESYFEAPDTRRNALLRPTQLPNSSATYRDLWSDAAAGSANHG